MLASTPKSTKVLGRLEAAAARAAAWCARTQDSRGAWCVLPDARVFETALVGLALERAGGAAEAVAGARRAVAALPVQRHHPVPAAVEAGLRELLLGQAAPVDLTDPSFRGEVFSSRARLMQAVALHLGREVHSPWTEAQLRADVAKAWARCADAQLKQWSKVELAAMHALLQARQGAQAEAAAAVAGLPALQSENGSFCDNVVSTAMALLALSAAAPGSDCWRRCRQYLLDARQADGTWRFCASDIWDTTLLLRAWQGAGALERHTTDAAVRFLVRAQNDDGGWAFLSGLESDSDTTAAALLALEGRPEGAAAAGRALRYLAERQLEDGLWRTWHFRGDPPTADVVAHIVSALEAHAGRHAIRTAPAVRWLAGLYTDGGWQAGWYRGRPYAALEIGRALPAASAVRRAAIGALAEGQNADGGFGHEPGEASFAGPTGLALAAMLETLPADDPRPGLALAWLLEREEEGTWPGRPEMYGPRPLLSHFRTHTQAFVGFGLAAAQRRLAARAPLAQTADLSPRRQPWAE